MTLNFTLTETDALAFTERFHHDSKAHQAIRTRARWSLPLILLVIACFSTWRFGPLPASFAIFLIFSVAWWLFYPRWFDARVRALVKKQLSETSNIRNLGTYELQLLNEHLHSISPLGSSTYAWAGIDRVVMDSDYLYIFLSGPMGYPIRISEIGLDAAQRAHDFISERINATHP
jgi:hypothetical protein